MHLYIFMNNLKYYSRNFKHNILVEISNEKFPKKI